MALAMEEKSETNSTQSKKNKEPHSLLHSTQQEKPKDSQPESGNASKQAESSPAPPTTSRKNINLVT